MIAGAEHTLPPLSLYVHLPWCVRKCPYCDFNSHVAGGHMDRDRYVSALIRDLEAEAAGEVFGCQSSVGIRSS